MRTSRIQTTVMTANSEVQTKEATAYVKQLDLPRQSCASLKKLPQYFPWWNSVRVMGIHTTWRAAKTTSHQKWQENWSQHIELFSILWFLVYQRVLPQLHLHLLLHHLHHKIPNLMSTDTPKIQYQKEVEVRVRSYGETRCIDQQKPKTQEKMKDTTK